MLSYVARRLLYALLTFIGITVVTFVLIHSVPGDPVSFYISQRGLRVSPAIIEALRAEYRLDEPLPAQYAGWVRDVVTGDFGRSFVDRQPVAARIRQKLPNTFELNLVAFLLAALIGIPAGLAAGARTGHLADRASSVVFFILFSLPTFWVALMLVQLFSMRLELLPLFGMSSLTSEGGATAAERLVDHLRHLVLPVVTLALSQIAIFARFSRGAAAEVIRQDFITAARARGVGTGAVLWKHTFRNALVPLITLLALTVPYLISGSVIVEQIFQWDGVGRLYVESIFARDYPTILALTVITAVVTLLASIIADILYALADPRIRLEERR
ncbi:MAG TPA: ABC transporter permease [Thermoanaerobaculia bacterium]|nr:ABC transporter permease [Thermoanaerobaculia bacterium]